MWFVLFAGFVGVAIVVALFLFRVAKINYIPAYVTVLAFVAFFIPAFTIILLPIDLASGRADQLNHSKTTDYPVSYLHATVLLKLWRASYWLSFALTLTILPITQSFVESGYKEPVERLISSVRQNLRYQGIYLAIGLFGIIYIVLNTELRSFSDFKSLLIALANTWGLFLAINFLGHGLVNVPRRLWRAADYRREMYDLEIRATTIHELLEDAITAELDLAVQVVAWEKTTADAEWLDDMANCIPEAIAKARTSRARSTSGWFGSNRSQNAPTGAQLAELMQNIRNSKRERYQAEWKQLVDRYTYLVDCTSSSSRNGANHRTFRSRLNPKAAHWYYSFVLPWLWRLLALMTGLLSVSILWAELAINTTNPALRFVTLPITTGHTELWSALLMSYMALCCYSTLLRLKIFNRYALLDYGHTSPSSLFFYASYCCRVTIPLSYNFTNLLPMDFRDCSTFSQFLGNAIDLQPLGTVFNNWLPLYILVPVLLTLGNSYDKLKHSFGIGTTWIDDDDTEEGSAAEGREQLCAEISRKYGELPDAAPSYRHQRAQRNDREDADDRARFLDETSIDDEEASDSRTQLGTKSRAWSMLNRGVQQGLSSIADKIQHASRGRDDPNIL